MNPDDSATTHAPIFLVADAGLPSESRVSADPLADWFELMELMEMLCPEWPAPEPCNPAAVYLL
jgi:hypothetical protein